MKEISIQSPLLSEGDDILLSTHPASVTNEGSGYPINKYKSDFLAELNILFVSTPVNFLDFICYRLVCGAESGYYINWKCLSVCSV